ncbi:TfoX/Sxy family protein [Kitasatospora aureofaciens]|uniref:TfoX/Sxy family protein n=1 Tax=Kitasatospora aureofaciens TaxID=1894 RepID=UPI001C45FCB9|nr:TfoX/Sxy family protein [Kitasatospora aureofaciens]MBV6698962.1 TfoX/Sxy family protein [Kitasatospora aureofaciens]
MTRRIPDPEDRFASLVEELAALDGVALPSAGRRFGSDALKADGHIFAMLSAGRLVLKLPRTRVDELVAAGEGAHFDAGKGKPMREWLALDPASTLPWPQLACEAYAFVRH